jgi:ribosome-associated protein
MANSAADKKAENIVVINMKKLLYFVDYFVICTAENSRQIKAIADNVKENMVKKNICVFREEGLEESSWLLMDYSDVIGHVFLPEARKFYDLESLWSDAPREIINCK